MQTCSGINREFSVALDDEFVASLCLLQNIDFFHGSGDIMADCRRHGWFKYRWKMHNCLKFKCRWCCDRSNQPVLMYHVFVPLCQVYRADYGLSCVRACVCVAHTHTSLLNSKCGGLSRYGCNANDFELSRPLIRESQSIQPQSENYLSVKRFLNKRQIAIDRVILWTDGAF